MNSSDPIQQKTWVKQIMNSFVVSVDSLATATDVAKLMEDTGVGSVVVLDNNLPVGIVTDRDFAIKIAANNLSFDISAEKIMSSPLVTINHNELISAAAERMTSKKIRKLAVTENGKIVGVVTATDLVTQLAK